MKAFRIIRVSGEDQLQKYGPEAQWFDECPSSDPSPGIGALRELFNVPGDDPVIIWDVEVGDSTVHRGLIKEVQK